MPFRSEEQRKWMWANKPKMAKKWTDEHGSTPVKAKKGKYQEFEHPQHDILPLEHMEKNVSSKERIERLLDERKKKKLVKAAEGELVREKTRGTGAAVKGTDHYVMQGMDAAQEGKLIQVPTRGTGAAVKGTDHYVMEGMDAAKKGKLIGMRTEAGKRADEKLVAAKKLERLKSMAESGSLTYHQKVSEGRKELSKKRVHQTGGPIKAKDSKWITVKPKTKVPKWDKSIKHFRSIYDLAKETAGTDRITAWDLENAREIIKSRKLGKLAEVDPGAPYKTGGVIKAKKGIGLPPATKYKKYLESLKKVTTKPSTFLERRRQLAGFGGIKFNKKFNWKAANKGLPFSKSLSKIVGSFPLVSKKSKSFYFKDAPKPSDFLSRRMTLGSMRSIPTSSKILTVLKKIGKRTAIGKAVAAATVVAGAYEAGKRKLFTKDKDKKKVDKKSIGGETVVTKSGGGYIDNLL